MPIRRGGSKAVKALSKLFKGDVRMSVGLDIGSYSAKAVVLSRAGRKPQLTGFALERITGGGGQSILPDPSAAVGKIVSILGLSGENLATAISGQQVVMRHIEMPKMNNEEIRAAIKYETDIHFPFKLEDAMLDFHILEKGEGVDDNKMKVFMVAARRETVDSHLKVIGEAGITPGRISVDAAALANACEGSIDTAGKCAALVNVGARKTTIVVISNGAFSFSREAEIGCAKLSSAISTALSVSNDEADLIVRERIHDYDAYLSSFVTDVAREVKSSIDYYEERSGAKVDVVYMDGGGALIDGIDRHFSEDFGLDVKGMKAMDEAMIGLEPGKKEELAALSPLFTIAYGLALSTGNK